MRKRSESSVRRICRSKITAWWQSRDIFIFFFQIKGYVVKAVLRAFGWISFTVAMVILFLNNAFELAASFWLVEWTDDEYLQNTSLVNTTLYTEKTVMYVSVYAVLGILQG